MRPSTAFTSLFALVACATPSEEAPPPPAPTETIVGVPRVVGTAAASWVELHAESGSVRVVGDLEPEVRALQGARIRASGTPADEAGIGDGFRVLDYAVLEIGGEVPIVGTLLRVGGDFWIAEPDSVGGTRLQLIGVPEAIGEVTGGKIWVVGMRGTSEVRVQSYGVIRRPPGS